MFARACSTFDDSWHYIPDPDEIARTIIDFWIVMEIIFAKRGEREKRIVERAAALLSPVDKEENALIKGILEAKDVRNRIVHGDEPVLVDELVTAVEDLRTWTAKSLAALLRMGGDQRRIIEGLDDPDLKAKNRRLVPTYDT